MDEFIQNKNTKELQAEAKNIECLRSARSDKSRIDGLLKPKLTQKAGKHKSVKSVASLQIKKSKLSRNVQNVLEAENKMPTVNPQLPMHFEAKVWSL